jgi:hypothetical protein
LGSAGAAQGGGEAGEGFVVDTGYMPCRSGGRPALEKMGTGIMGWRLCGGGQRLLAEP